MPKAPPVLLDVPSSPAQSRRQSNCADVRFARPNIQIYDARGVDLYQWVYVRYFVGVKVQRQRQSAVKLGSRPKFQNGSRWLSQTLSRISNPAANHRERRFALCINKDWRRECQSTPPER